MNPVGYKFMSMQESKRHKGSTKVSKCKLPGFLKLDGEESNHCAYNEMVCNRLGHTVHAPIAAGGLVATHGGQGYVSMEIYSPGESLPNLDLASRDKIARRYQKEIAGLVAFDIWVGNWDRGRNVKVSTNNGNLHLFCGFDHSHTLLDSIGTNEELNISLLASNALIVQTHPFYGYVDNEHLISWLRRVEGIPDYLILECCDMGGRFNGVTHAMQQDLSKALIQRREIIMAIVLSNVTTINAPCHQQL